MTEERQSGVKSPCDMWHGVIQTQTDNIVNMKHKLTANETQVFIIKENAEMVGSIYGIHTLKKYPQINEKNYIYIYFP